jgi:hypothetical protein
VRLFAADSLPHHQIVYHAEHTELADIQKKLASVIVDPLFLIAVTYASDVAFSRDEFIYLIGFDTGDTISDEQLYKLFFYLCKKRKFERITVSLYPHEKGYALHVDLEAFWTFFSDIGDTYISKQEQALQYNNKCIFLQSMLY